MTGIYKKFKDKVKRKSFEICHTSAILQFPKLCEPVYGNEI